MNKFNVERFISAQNDCGIYDHALHELQSGKKLTHWMWFVFPQLDVFGYSFYSTFYGICGIEEAREYWANPLLKNRYLECCEALRAIEDDDPVMILGPTDALKLRSSLTLFNAVEPLPVFAELIEKFYGAWDDKTLQVLDEAKE